MNRNYWPLIPAAYTAIVWALVVWLLFGCTSHSPTAPGENPVECREYGFSHDSGADTVFVVPCDNNNALTRKGRG